MKEFFSLAILALFAAAAGQTAVTLPQKEAPPPIGRAAPETAKGFLTVAGEPPLPGDPANWATVMPITPSGKITLLWNYYLDQEPSTNLVTFRIYATTNLALANMARTNAPLAASFKLLGTDAGWELLETLEGVTNRQAVLQVVPGERYFAMTASNFWGESSFSEVVTTPPLPRCDGKLDLRRD